MKMSQRRIKHHQGYFVNKTKLAALQEFMVSELLKENSSMGGASDLLGSHYCYCV